MDCERIRKELPAYVSGENCPDNPVAEHLEKCEFCARERDVLEKLKSAFLETDSVTASEDFRASVLAKTVDSPSPKSARISRIREKSRTSFREWLNTEVLGRLRGPSFAYSVIIHVLLVSLLLYVFKMEFTPRIPEIPVQLQSNRLYTERLNCRSTFTVSLMDNTVDLSGVLKQNHVYVSTADRNCVMLFRNKPETIRNSMREVQNGLLKLDLRDLQVFNGDPHLQVMVFSNRIELWSQKQWREYRDLMDDCTITFSSCGGFVFFEHPINKKDENARTSVGKRC